MAYDDDDVLVGRQSHPVVTTLLILGCLALVCAITLSVKQLGRYVNPETRKVLNNFEMTAVQMAERDMPKLDKQDDVSAERY